MDHTPGLVEHAGRPRAAGQHAPPGRPSGRLHTRLAALAVADAWELGHPNEVDETTDADPVRENPDAACGIRGWMTPVPGATVLS